MIIIEKNPGSQMGSPAAAEEEGEARTVGRGGSGEEGECERVESTAPKARSRSREGVAMNEATRISPRVSPKLPSSASSSDMGRASGRNEKHHDGRSDHMSGPRTRMANH